MTGMDLQSQDDPTREIRAILEQALPTECDRLGKSIVDQVSRGRTEFAKAPGGNFLDGATALTAAIAAVNLITALLKLREDIAKMRSSGASEGEVESRRRGEIARAESEAKPFRLDKRKRVIRAVFPDHE